VDINRNRATISLGKREVAEKELLPVITTTNHTHPAEGRTAYNNDVSTVCVLENRLPE
jgi:hypothetical protein